MISQDYVNTVYQSFVTYCRLYNWTKLFSLRYMWLSYTSKFLLQFQPLRVKLTIWVTGWYISVSSVWDSSNPRGEGSKPWGEGCSCWMGDKPNPRMSSILLSPSKNVHISSSLEKKIMNLWSVYFNGIHLMHAWRYTMY